MDFEKIDDVDADDLGHGDIVKNDDGEYVQILAKGEDDGDTIAYPCYNLSTGDDDDIFLTDPAGSVELYRSY